MPDAPKDSQDNRTGSEIRPSTATLLAPILIVILALVIRLPLLDAPGFLHDQEQFVIWGYIAQERGLGGVYDHFETPGGPKRLSNYPPVQILICRALAALYPTVAGRRLDAEVVGSVSQRADTPPARAAYTLFKWPAVIADIACALMLFYGLRRGASVRCAAMIAGAYAILPSVWHNSAVWGAVDSIPIVFLFAALESASRRRAAWLGMFAALAVLTKPQMVIFLPILALMTLRGGFESKSRPWLSAGAAALLTVAALVAPFWSALGGVWDAYFEAPGFYPLTHLNGFSAWFLGTPLVESHLQENLLEHYTRDDVVLFAGITARQLGIVGFLIIAGFSYARLWMQRGDACTLRWCLRIVPLAFFVCSTQMHERYLYPVVGMWAWTARPTGRWVLSYIAVSLVAAINVLWVWVGPFDGAWATQLASILHRRWLGVLPGVACSAGLLWLLAWTIVREARRMLENRVGARHSS